MDKNTILSIVVLVYIVWAIYSGYSFINGRFNFLEEKKPLNRILKVLAILLVGSVYGIIKLFILVFRFIFSFLEFMRKL